MARHSKSFSIEDHRKADSGPWLETNSQCGREEVFGKGSSRKKIGEYGQFGEFNNRS